MEREKAWKIDKILGIVLLLIAIVLLIYIYLFDFERSVRRAEETRALHSLSDLATQGAVLAENKISFTQTFLSSMADQLKDVPDIQNDQVMERLEESLMGADLGIVRFGVADREGRSRVSNGQWVDIWDRDYYQQSMAGAEYVSGANSSKLVDEQVVFISVPVFDSADQVKGVLYGVIEVDSFDLYEDTVLGEDTEHIHIIDSNGKMITQSGNCTAPIDHENFFRGLEHYGADITESQMKKALAKGESVFTWVEADGVKTYICVTPFQLNNWYILTGISEQAIEENISYIQTPVIHLIVKLLITTAIFFFIYVVAIMQDKRKIERLNQDLKLKERVFRVAASNIGSFVFIFDIQKKQVEFMNYDGKRLGNIPRLIQEFPNSIGDYMSKKNRDSILDALPRYYLALNEKKETSELDFPIEREGNNAFYQVQFTNFYNEQEKPVYSIGMLTDITAQKEKELQLQKEEQLRGALLSDALAFYEVDLNENRLIRDLSNRREFAYSYTDFLVNYVEKMVAKSYQEQVLHMCSVGNLQETYARQEDELLLEYECILESGEVRWNSCEIHLERDSVTGNIIAFLMIRDIHEQKIKELHLEKKAVFDALTQTYNRSEAEKRINRSLQRMDGETRCAFMILDLDYFKQLNDTLGHMIGDKALVEVAGILKSHFRDYDIVGRLGGDEFLIFLKDVPPDVIDKILVSLQKKLQLTYEKNGVQRSITTSIGVSLAPIHGKTFTELYEKADAALYQVKKRGKNGYLIYSTEW